MRRPNEIKTSKTVVLIAITTSSFLAFIEATTPMWFIVGNLVVLGLGFVLSFGYWTTDFLVVQRAFSARDLRAARMTPIIASFFKMAVPFLVIMTGLVAFILANDPQSGFSLLRDGGQINYDSALPLLIQRYYPAGLMGLGITALLAAFMAGQAGNVSAFNTVGVTSPELACSASKAAWNTSHNISLTFTGQPAERFRRLSSLFSRKRLSACSHSSNHCVTTGRFCESMLLSSTASISLPMA